MPNGKLNPQQEFKELTRQSNRILIAIGRNPTKDAVAASLGLMHALGRKEKSVTVVCPGELPAEAKNLGGWEKIASTLERNFVITLKSAVGNLDKVSYYTEGDDLNLVIHPHAGAPEFLKDQIEYKSGGTNFDLVFVLGSQQLSNLGELYTDKEGLYTNVPIINIDKDSQNSRFGKINLIEPTASSISEIVVFFLKTAGISADQEAATDFLAGIDWATDNFQSPQVSAGAFEAAAFCLKAGGRRKGAVSAVPLSVSPTVGTFQPSTFPPVKEEKKEVLPPMKPDSDWLKPKIYKGGKLV